MKWNSAWYVSMEFKVLSFKSICILLSSKLKRYLDRTSATIRLVGTRKHLKIVKLGSLVSHTEWSNISERNSNLIENLKKGPELTL